MIVAGTPRGLPPPKPVATAMYCLPSIGEADREALAGRREARFAQTTLPSRSRRALKLRSRSPANATPPAVESTDVMNDARCSSDQVCSRVSTLNAASLPTLPFVPGIV